MTYRFGGLHLNMFGDIVMGTAAFRILKRFYPDSHITAFVGADYREIAPLLLDHPDIDKVHICHSPKDGFDGIDLEWIRGQKFTHLFNPMADHSHDDPWWQHRVQPLEIAHMHGLPTAGDSGKCELIKWFKETEGLRGYVAFAPYAGMYSPSNDKRLSEQRAQQIVDMIVAKGFKVLQIGGKTEPRLQNATFIESDYFVSIRNILGCRLFIHTDTGSGWAISAYGHPQIGLYSHRYHGKEFVKNIQPVTNNGIFFDAANVNNIELEAIEKALDTLK